MAEEIQVIVNDTQEEVSIYVGTPRAGVLTVTGDGVGGTATDVVMTFPTPVEISAVEEAPEDGTIYGRQDAGWVAVSVDDELTADELAAINGANTPSASNVFATMDDVGGSTDNTVATKSVLDDDLATLDAAGLTTYYNALDPAVMKSGDESWLINIVDDGDEILKTFDLVNRGKGLIGDGATVLTAANFQERSGLSPLKTENTTAEVRLHPSGNFCNTETANTEDTIAVVYTNASNPVGEWAKILIDTTGKTSFPSIGTNIRLLKGDDFEPSERFIVKIYHDGFAVTVQFVKIVYDSLTDFGLSLLFVTSPLPRTEVDGTALNPTCNAEDAISVEFFYKNLSDTWVSIDNAVNTSGDVWEIASWTPAVPATAIKAIATYPDTTTQEVENILYSLSIYDTFTDTNSTVITAHTPDVNLGVNAWSVDSGTWDIQGNKLKNSSGVTVTPEVMYHDLGYKDCIFKFTLNSIDAVQIILRYDTEDDFLLLYSTSGITSLTEKVSGVSTVIWSTATQIITGNALMELWLIDGELKIIKDSSVLFFIPIITATNHTKFGFRRGGAVSTSLYDNVSIIPIAPQPIDASVSYAVTKSGLPIIPKGFNAPKDSNQIGDFDIAVVGTTNYLLYSTRDDNNDFKGLCLATSDVSDPHNWTPQTAYALEVDDVAGCGIWLDGSTWYVVYTDRTEGKLRYATGASLGSLTPQGVIKDLTGSGLYIRQSSIIVEDSVWYVFSTIRTDQSAGEFGYLGMFSGSSLETLGDIKEVLSNPGYADDTCSLTGVSVKKNEDNGYYEMFYAAYKGIVGSDYVHTINLAISKNIKGKFKRVSVDSFIYGETTFDSAGSGAPCRMPDTNILYYQYNGSATAGGGDGITYATLAED